MDKSLVALALACAPMAIGACLASPAAAQGLAVYDAANHAENLLQAARALEQINHQLSSLQNEARMLDNMARNLERIDFPQLERIKSAMQRIDSLMRDAQGIGLEADRLEERMRTLFPGAERAMSGDQKLASARVQLDAAMAAYRRAMAVQAEVAGNVREDSGLMSDLVGRSQDASGALQAQQAASQLLALSLKQQFQIQQMMAAEFQGEALERSRRAQAEADGRASTRRFLGSGKAYSPDRD